jgi:hypothetical protein
MSLRIATAALLLSLSISAMAQETVTAEGARSLNLSLPRDVSWSSPVRPDRTPPDVSRADSVGVPDMGAGSTIGRGSRLPYGTGYEARQRDRAESEFGNASETGRGHGGGGRMGRGR